MTDQEQHQQRVDYFNARYWKVAHYRNVSHHMDKLISITRPTGVATETEATNG
jgi:hypothetical protein